MDEIVYEQKHRAERAVAMAAAEVAAAKSMLRYLLEHDPADRVAIVGTRIRRAHAEFVLLQARSWLSREKGGA